MAAPEQSEQSEASSANIEKKMILFYLSDN